MIQVIDLSGNVVNGIFKKEDGSIVVKNDNEYLKAVSFKNKIDSMQDEITTLNKLVNKLIQTMDKTNE